MLYACKQTGYKKSIKIQHTTDATGDNDTQALKTKSYHSMTNCLNELCNSDYKRNNNRWHSHSANLSKEQKPNVLEMGRKIKPRRKKKGME